MYNNWECLVHAAKKTDNKTTSNKVAYHRRRCPYFFVLCFLVGEEFSAPLAVGMGVGVGVAVLTMLTK